MKHENQLKLDPVLTQLKELLSKNPEKLEDVLTRRPTYHGVYAISDPSDSEIVYVGMSTTAVEGVGQRLYDHATIKGSPVRVSIGGDRQMLKVHNVRVIQVDDPIARHNLEAVAIGALSPKYNRVRNSKAFLEEVNPEV